MNAPKNRRIIFTMEQVKDLTNKNQKERQGFIMTLHPFTPSLVFVKPPKEVIARAIQ